MPEEGASEEQATRRGNYSSWKRIGWRWFEFLYAHPSQVLMILLIVSLGINVIATVKHTRSVIATQDPSPKKNLLSYGSDAKYMSLDKKYDALWDELKPDNGIVSLPPWGSDGKSIAGHYGHIAMYVLADSDLYPANKLLGYTISTALQSSGTLCSDHTMAKR